MPKRQEYFLTLAAKQYAGHNKLDELKTLSKKCGSEIVRIEVYLNQLRDLFFKKTKALAYGYHPSKISMNQMKTAIIEEYRIPLEEFKYKNQLVADDFLGNGKNIHAFMNKEFEKSYKKARSTNEEYDFSCNSLGVCSLHIKQDERNLCVNALDIVFNCSPCIVDGEEHLDFTFVYSIDCNV